MKPLEEEAWIRIKTDLLSQHSDVRPGKMMSADALTYRSKVFVFFSTKGGRVGLGGRIGREIDPATLGLRDWQHLAPFKTKPPMKDWIVAGIGDVDEWMPLTLFCLDKCREIHGVTGGGGK